jgi:hypothetical protein
MPADVPKPGAILDDRYEVVRTIGEGAHGVVLEARRRIDGLRVALKLLRASRDASDRAERLDREARAIGRIDHPGIVRLVDSGRFAPDDLYVALELVPGPSLAQVLRAEGALSPAEAKRALLQVAEALAAAHAAGIVHRDLHPGNVILTGSAPSRDAKVVDFGIAALAEDPRLTPAGAAPGTVSYMAPEQLAGETTPQSDVYAWGLVFLEALLGRRMVSGKGFYEIAFKQLRDDAVPIPQGLLAHPLGQLLARAVAKSLHARLRTIGEAASALASIDVTHLVVPEAAAPTSPRAASGPFTAAPASPPRSSVERRYATLVACVPIAASTGWEARVREVARELDGLVLPSDGGPLVIAFGVPVAREDDARRAALAASTLAAEPGERANGDGAARCGVASGLLVVDPGAPELTTAEHALGRAALALALAAPVGGALADEPTRDLLRTRFGCEPVTIAEGAEGATATAYRIVVEHDVPVRAATTPLVGRVGELETLRRLWADACAGRPRAVLLLGEAGIGKSRLVQAFGEWTHADGGRWVDCACSPNTKNTPLHPLLERARAVMGAARGDDRATLERKLLEEGTQLGAVHSAGIAKLAELLSATSAPPLVGQPPQGHELVAAAVARRTEAAPMLLTLADVQWSDPTTLELLAACLSVPRARLLVVLTARAELALPGVLRDAAELYLGRLEPDEIATIARAASGGALDDDRLEHVVSAADGVPLYAEELARSFARGDDHAPAPGSIPPSLRGLLTARLDRLGEAKRSAQLASVAGHEVSFALLAAVAPWGEEALAGDLDAMLARGLVCQRGVLPDASFQFVHHVVADAAYDSMLPDVRLAWHAAIADALVERFGPELERSPELAARHFARAGRASEAATWAARAGRQAFGRSAPVEAVRHLHAALEALADTPPSAERDALELEVQRALVAALTATEGITTAGVEAALERARALHSARGEVDQTFVVERMLGAQRAMRAEVAAALADAERGLAEAGSVADPTLAACAHIERGVALFYGGRHAEAVADFDHAIVLVGERDAGAHGPRAVDPAVLAGTFRAHALWHLGWPERAIAAAEACVRRARAVGPDYGELLAMNGLLVVHLMRRDVEAAERTLDALVQRAGRTTLPTFSAFCDLSRRWLAAQRGEDRTDGADEAIRRFRAGGTSRDASMLFTLLGDACLAVGSADRGLAIVEQGLASVRATGARFLEPELHRLRGALLVLRGGPGDDAAHAAFDLALATAEAAGSRSLALRAACALARRGIALGEPARARAVLSPIHAAFDEGFADRDLTEARGLLDELGRAGAGSPAT